MPSNLTIDHVDAQLDVTPRPIPAASGRSDGNAGLPSDRRLLTEMLRPIVLDIIREQMLHDRRTWGR